ncbi:ATP-binding cassette domain-containing protein [Nocardioides sp. W3-2-3]|nr:ATP-binding cassette domain-containing protein [Nocardioides convexus]
MHIEDLTIGAGTTGLVGVNGAGKSTLLATLAGARRPEGGQVTLNEQNLYGRGRDSGAAAGRLHAAGLAPSRRDDRRRCADLLRMVARNIRPRCSEACGLAP